MSNANAYFAGGCFWCITPTFAEHDGVCSVTSGYSGGIEADPSYEDVKAQRTGHRETVKITYNPEKIGYAELLDIFINGVDPFDGEGQYIDRGRSYTLAVYYSNTEERKLAEQKLAALENDTGKKPCISLEPFIVFYDAEEYHQDYYLKNPEAFEEEMRNSGRRG